MLQATVIYIIYWQLKDMLLYIFIACFPGTQIRHCSVLISHYLKYEVPAIYMGTCVP